MEELSFWPLNFKAEVQAWFEATWLQVAQWCKFSNLEATVNRSPEYSPKKLRHWEEYTMSSICLQRSSRSVIGLSHQSVHLLYRFPWNQNCRNHSNSTCKKRHKKKRLTMWFITVSFFQLSSSHCNHMDTSLRSIGKWFAQLSIGFFFLL